LLIKSAIENIAHKTTLVVIAHRLSTIVNADFIYVIHKGRIIEQGVFTELLNKNDKFNYMAQLQGINS
jgi:ABC-type multidrug transport system fused ATPase/permease subunit